MEVLHANVAIGHCPLSLPTCLSSSASLPPSLCLSDCLSLSLSASLPRPLYTLLSLCMPPSRYFSASLLHASLLASLISYVPNSICLSTCLHLCACFPPSLYFFVSLPLRACVPLYISLPPSIMPLYFPPSPRSNPPFLLRPHLYASSLTSSPVL